MKWKKHSGTVSISNLSLFIIWILLGSIGVSCGPTLRLPKSLASAKELPMDPYGAWIVASRQLNDSQEVVVGGELLAIRIDTVVPKALDPIEGAQMESVEFGPGMVEVQKGSNRGKENKKTQSLYFYVGEMYLISDNGFVTLPLQQIQHASIAIYRKAGGGGYLAGTIAGTIASISNGAYAAITGPAWLISGTIITATEATSTHHIREYPVLEWEDLKKYARFPQGMPSQVDPKELTSPYIWKP